MILHPPPTSKINGMSSFNSISIHIPRCLFIRIWYPKSSLGWLVLTYIFHTHKYTGFWTYTSDTWLRAWRVVHSTQVSGGSQVHAKIYGKILLVVSVELSLTQEGRQPTHIGQGSHGCYISSRVGDRFFSDDAKRDSWEAFNTSATYSFHFLIFLGCCWMNSQVTMWNYDKLIHPKIYLI